MVWRNEYIFLQKHKKLYFCERLLCYMYVYYMNEFPGVWRFVLIQNMQVNDYLRA